MGARTKVDDATVSTIWHAMQSICREMRHTVELTAQSSVIAQLHDLSVGIFDASAQALAIPVGIPVHHLGTEFAIKDIASKFKDNLKPGDVFLTNDPYHGGHNCHLPDWGFIKPIFYKDELLFWTLVRGHQQDSGGSYPGGYFPGGYDIHAEGICIPPTKVFDGGKEQTAIFELIWNNVRFPEEIRQDNYAMIASAQICEKRLIELLDKYGKATTLECVDEMLSRTEKAVRTEIKKIPSGKYYGEAATDDDGTILDEPVWVRCDLEVKGDEIFIDFSRSDAQRQGFINSIYASTYANAIAAVILTLDPAIVDFHNQGSMKPIHVTIKPGTWVSAQYPACVGGSPVQAGVPTIESVLIALAQACPERAIAAAGRNRTDRNFGLDPRTGKNYVRLCFGSTGSLGAVNGYDGYSGTFGIQGRGVLHRADIEEDEIRFPWLVLQYEFAPDLMGAGKWRGGFGIHWKAINKGVVAGFLTGNSDGDATQGHGVLGGQPTFYNRTYIRRGNEEIRVKSHRLFWLQPGDIEIKLASGGGGVGNPAERDPGKVLEDVRNEVVSLEAARDIYKVEINPKTMEIDREKTEKLRAGQV